MKLVLPPHAQEIPDDAQLTVMRADGSAWVLHLHMRDLRGLLEAQPLDRNGVIDECLQLVEGRGNAAAGVLENPLATVSARRAAVTALNFYNQMAADIRGLKQ